MELYLFLLRSLSAEPDWDDESNFDVFEKLTCPNAPTKAVPLFIGTDPDRAWDVRCLS